jgi:hypothetical protein
VPARVGHVVVELVVGVPAEDHVAEAEATVERGEELVAVQVLATQDAVDVVDADLHVREVAVPNDLARVLGRAYCPRFHRSPLLVSKRLF